MSPIEQRRAWAYALISRCQTPPAAYGSEAWLALPDGPEKVAAVVIAAEAWALAGDTLEDDLRAELQFAQEAEDRRWQELHDDAVSIAQETAKSPHIGRGDYAERRAREIAQASLPRPTDQYGGNGRRLRVVGGGRR